MCSALGNSRASHWRTLAEGLGPRGDALDAVLGHVGQEAVVDLDLRFRVHRDLVLLKRVEGVCDAAPGRVLIGNESVLAVAGGHGTEDRFDGAELREVDGATEVSHRGKVAETIRAGRGSRCGGPAQARNYRT